MQVLHVQSLNFNFRLNTAFILLKLLHCAIPENTQTGEWGLRIWNFPGVLKEQHFEIPGIN